MLKENEGMGRRSGCICTRDESVGRYERARAQHRRHRFTFHPEIEWAEAIESRGGAPSPLKVVVSE
jgi:hypothetical protein